MLSLGALALSFGEIMVLGRAGVPAGGQPASPRRSAPRGGPHCTGVALPPPHLLPASGGAVTTGGAEARLSRQTRQTPLPRHAPLRWAWGGGVPPAEPGRGGGGTGAPPPGPRNF